VTSPGLRAALAAFDAIALATLANAGLVRRAARDVADGKVRLIDEDEDKAVVEADGAQVRIDAGGPNRATCTCSAARICRHRLAAVLLLQTADDEAEARETESSASDLVALLDPFQDSVVERWAGKAAWRAAIDIAEEPAGVAPAANGISVTLVDLAGSVLILQGQGLDGIVSKAPRTRTKALHAAAVIIARRHFGLPAGEAGRELSPQDAAVAMRPDAAFLAQVEAALADAARFAFNLAPEPVEEALFTLSVSSRADALPRLGRQLRTLAAQLRLKRSRAFSFDPDDCLELLGTAFAVVRALRRDGEVTPERSALLRGAARQHYARADPLTMVCCGSESWQRLSGARGVTGIFYEPANDRWLVAGPARGPGQDPLFKPAIAYRTEALWGSHTLATCAGHSLRLEGAGISEEGRLANPATARAHSQERALAGRAEWPARIADWWALRDRLAIRFGVGTGDLKRSDYAILAPSRFAPPIFDDLAQELIWPVADDAGRWIGLTTSDDDAVATARREQIEELGRRRWSGDVLVRAQSIGQRINLTPIAVLSGEEVLSLGLDTLPDEGWRGHAMFGWLLDARGRNVTKAFVRAKQDATRTELGKAWQLLIDLAEAGPSNRRPSSFDRLGETAARLEMMGMPTPAAFLDALVKDPNDGFLAAAYALLVARAQRRDLPWLLRTGQSGATATF
jgi:hypothetical protein